MVDFTGEAPVVTDGPYGETKELFGGFYLLGVATLDETVAWATDPTCEVSQEAFESRRPWADVRIGKPLSEAQPSKGPSN